MNHFTRFVIAVILMFLIGKPVRGQMKCSNYSYYYTTGNAVYYNTPAGMDSVVISMFPWDTLTITGYVSNCATNIGTLLKDGVFYASAPATCIFPITSPGTYHFWGEYPEYKTYKVYFIQPTGLAEEESQQISIFPNPAHDAITISGDTKSYEIYLADITQRIIQQIPDSSFPELDISGLNSGIYYLIFQSGSERFARKFVRL